MEKQRIPLAERFRFDVNKHDNGFAEVKLVNISEDEDEIVFVGNFRVTEEDRQQTLAVISQEFSDKFVHEDPTEVINFLTSAFLRALAA